MERDLRELLTEGMDWSHLAQDKDQQLALTYTVIDTD
jgi:hypothetical protein